MSSWFKLYLALACFGTLIPSFIYLILSWLLLDISIRFVYFVLANKILLRKFVIRGEGGKNITQLGGLVVKKGLKSDYVIYLQPLIDKTCSFNQYYFWAKQKLGPYK